MTFRAFGCGARLSAGTVICVSPETGDCIAVARYSGREDFWPAVQPVRARLRSTTARILCFIFAILYSGEFLKVIPKYRHVAGKVQFMPARA